MKIFEYILFKTIIFFDWIDPDGKKGSNFTVTIKFLGFIETLIFIIASLQFIQFKYFEKVRIPLIIFNGIFCIILSIKLRVYMEKKYKYYTNKFKKLSKTKNYMINTFTFLFFAAIISLFYLL